LEGDFAVKIGVKFKRLPNGVDLDMPKYAHTGDSGMDVMAAESAVLLPGQHKAIPCGFAIGIPEGFEAQVRPRGGLAAKSVIGIVNSPGTVDRGYTGEVMVILINHGTTSFKVERGMKIAQLVFAPVAYAILVPVTELDETARGDGRFGSTG
jgi:dUTP pyrophosphatase